MGQKLSPKQLTLYKLINELLMTEWDPCGVNGVPEARDEYDSYVPQIFKLAMDGSSPERIAKHLLFIENEQMCCKESKKVCLSVANKIVNKKKELGL